MCNIQTENAGNITLTISCKWCDGKLEGGNVNVNK